MGSLAKQLADGRRRRRVERWLGRAQSQQASHVGPGIRGCAEEESAPARLSRLAQWALTGRRVAAIIELYDWHKCPHCPADATALLAGLLLQMNGRGDAAALLQSQSAKHRTSDPILLRFQIALAATQRSPRAAQIAAQLHREHGHDPAVIRWLSTILDCSAARLPTVSEATINQLAGELLEQIDAIPSLVAAQRLSPDPQTIAMLRGAMRQMMRDVEDGGNLLTLCQAMADLAMLANDPDDARRWAHRGLRIDPYAAPLAIILSRLPDDPALGPPASTVLKGAVNAHPKYPDLRAALIRREASEGRVEIAKRRLNQWLQREPNHAMALRLHGEMAA